MTENLNKSNGIKSFLIKTLTDPILIYVTIVMMSIMHHYRSQLAVMYGILAYVIGWIVFRIFDFIKKHNVIGFFAYIILFLGFMRASGFFISEGYRDYPITFGLWFLTPQDSLLYNKLYTAAIFTLFLIFMLSVIYYFTRVRYRIFMNFLIFIIPFAIYGKEFEEMPIGYIIALAVGYVLIMALYRQLSDSDKVVVVDKPMAWRSAAVFTVLFALISAIIPKPAIQANREILETLINADALTDRLVSMLNVFRDTADGEQFRAASNSSVLYTARAEEPLRLKTSTFTYYNYNSDSWKTSELDSRYLKKHEYPASFTSNGGVTEAVREAAVLSSEFAEKYGLTELSEMQLEVPAAKSITIYTVYKSGDTAPVPQGAKQITSTTFNGTSGISGSGVFFADDKSFAFDDLFTYSYEPNGFFGKEQNARAVELISQVDDYMTMLDEADDVILDEYYYNADDEEYADELMYYSDILESSYSDCRDHMRSLLDYDDNQQIYDLAMEITAGLSTDYEKAAALEWYFINNDYVYDLTYRKEKGDNAVDFLFKTKIGVCYEYATAMTLLARAAGIPARYCEGFNMQTTDPNGTPNNYIIKGSDAHGFPELYIKGYGWMTFEPTMSDNPILGNERNASSMLTIAGLIILVLSVLALIFILLAPAMSHKLFVFINGRKAPDAAVCGAMRRICRLYGVTPVCTAHQAEDIVRQFSGADITAVTLLFERVQYGGEALTDSDRSMAMEQYSMAYTALKTAKKQERRSKKSRQK